MYTIKCNLAIKTDELVSHEKSWVNRKCVWLTERSWYEKITYLMTLFI